MIRTAVIVFVSLAASNVVAQDGVSLVRGEVMTASGRRGVIVRPAAAGRHPAVLHLHGSGDTVANNVAVLEIFARAGYVAIDVEYRQNGPNSPDLEDAIESLEYLKRQRFVKSDAIGLNGFSRGGRAALRLATRQRVPAVSAIAARTTGAPAPTILDDAERLTMPVLLQHGTEDPVPQNDLALLEQRLKSLRRRVTLISYKGAGHNDLPWEQVYTRVLEFFEKHLR